MGSSVTPPCPINAPREASNYDELLMQQSLNFSHSLKDLRNLQGQLYSAAEYFELSYNKDDEKQLVVDTFKEYATKALVSTVDHLGSVASKLDDFLKEQVDEVAATKLRFSCVEQRIQTCHGFIDIGGHFQQTLLLGTPKHHKRYMISDEGIVNAISISDSIHENCLVSPGDNPHRFKQAFQATRSLSLPPLIRRGHHGLLSNGSSSAIPSNFTFMKLTSKKEHGKRAVSPFRFSLKRSGSVINRSSSPWPSESNHRTPSEPRRSIMMRVNTERNKEKDMELQSRKSKHVLKALFSIHRSRKEGVPSIFRDNR